LAVLMGLTYNALALQEGRKGSLADEKSLRSDLGSSG